MQKKKKNCPKIRVSDIVPSFEKNTTTKKNRYWEDFEGMCQSLEKHFTHTKKKRIVTNIDPNMHQKFSPRVQFQK